MRGLAQFTGLLLAAVLILAASAGPGKAQTTADDPAIGPETNLPLPRFVSLRAREANARRGPSLSHRIDWVFQRPGMPLQVVAEYGHWRRVIDRDGQGGWVHFRMLSGARTAVVDEGDVLLRVRPEESARAAAILEPGVVARLGDCTTNWCHLTAEGYRGWVMKSQIWGVSPEELRD